MNDTCTLAKTGNYSLPLLASLLHLGTPKSTHSFKWVLPYVIALQYETQGRPLRILEYGPGCNSEQFLNSRVCQHLVSVEDNLAWYNEFASIFSIDGIKTDYHLVQVSSLEGKAYDGGHCWTEQEILSYANYPLRYGKGYFDIIFVDSADRADSVTVNGRRYIGWPVRNLCLECAGFLLSENGVVVVHDIPGPYHAMNTALAQNIHLFRHVRALEEFYTTVLSVSLDLSDLEQQIIRRYRLGFHTRLITRLLNHFGSSWYKSKITVFLMEALMGLYSKD